jgi:uncharacterized membrane protein YqhA
MDIVERTFERLLWQSRLVVLVAVVAGLVVGIGLFCLATLDAVDFFRGLAAYADFSLDLAQRSVLQTEILAQVVSVIDNYLLGIVMLIFSLGLYELFVSRIELAERNELASRVLLIKSLDDLKDRLAKVILLILVIKFFQLALRMKYDSPLELLYLALGIVLVAGAVWLSHGVGRHA